MAGTVEKLIDRRTLRRMAGARSFERGEDYFANGQVRALAEHEEAITAKVRGTREYRVKLWVEAGDLEFACTCPMGTAIFVTTLGINLLGDGLRDVLDPHRILTQPGTRTE